MESTKSVVIIRGLPGAGKSSFAELIVQPNIVIEADQFFIGKDNCYVFNPSKIKDAHEDAFRRFCSALNQQMDKIVVSNTSTQKWEFERYKNEAEKFGYKVYVIIVENYHGNGNIHEVPPEAIGRMKKRFEIKL